jgi:hypothetical protein
MPTATTAPVSPLARLRAMLPAPPPPTAADRARWARAARRRPVITDDAPDVGQDVPGLVLCARPDAFPIPEQTAQWFRDHGGTPTLVRALRQYMRAHGEKPTAARRGRAAGRVAARRR